MKMLISRSPDGLALVCRRWVIVLSVGRPVWWLPQWGHTAVPEMEEWHIGWLFACVGLLVYRGQAPGRVCERGGKHG